MPGEMASANSNDGNKSANNKSNTTSGKQSGPSAEQVVAGFQRLRQEQRSLAAKAAELEIEISEHSLVIDTLGEVDPTRKCYRMVGGVLVERTVKEVLPALEANKEQISKLVESLGTQMQTKGRELNEYRERYSIRIVGEDEGAGKSDAAASRDSGGDGRKSGTGVLVS